MSKRRTYSKEFKLGVIQQIYQRDSIRELADELGIGSRLYAWGSKYKTQSQQSLPCKGMPSRMPEEKELADVRIEWDILKKTVGIFTKKNCQKRAIDQELIFHSDRGIQYCYQQFQDLLKARPRVRQSMSRKGNCWDNAPAESFFKTFKAEPTRYSYNKFRGVIFTFIWYNHQRLHSTLDYRTPTEMQDYITQQQELAA